MVVKHQHISADKFMDLMHLPEYADRAVELVEGVIIEMPLPNPVHAAILANLTHLNHCLRYGKRYRPTLCR